MKCLHCGKPLSKIRLRSEGDFCCREHRERYRLMQGMNRVLEANEMATITRRRERPIPIPLQPAASDTAEKPRACKPGAPVTHREVREHPCPPMHVAGELRLCAGAGMDERPPAREPGGPTRRDGAGALAMRSPVVLPATGKTLRAAANGKPARAGAVAAQPATAGRAARRHEKATRVRVRRDPVLPRHRPAHSGRLNTAAAAPMRAARGPAYVPAVIRAIAPVWFRDGQAPHAASLASYASRTLRPATPLYAVFEDSRCSPIPPAGALRREIMPPLPAPQLVTDGAFSDARIGIGALPWCASLPLRRRPVHAFAAHREEPATPLRMMEAALHDLHVSIGRGCGALAGGNPMRSAPAIAGSGPGVPSAASVNMPARVPLAPSYAAKRERPVLRGGAAAHVAPPLRFAAAPERRWSAPQSAAQRLNGSAPGRQWPPSNLAHVPPEMVAPPRSLGLDIKEEARTFRADEAPFAVRAAVLTPVDLLVQGNITGMLDPGVASVVLEENFDSGLSRWAGATENWRVDFAGVRIGSLALFGPSLGLHDYQIEFVTKIEKGSICCVLRAPDLKNYYVVKIAKTPAAGYELVRYPVRNGVADPPVTGPLGVAIRSKAVFRVRARVAGDQFSLAVEDVAVAQWSDPDLSYGGIGFFAEAGDPARLYRLRLESLAGSANPGRGGISNLEC
ncbi:MAG: hypothetical protein ACE15B_13395 [Bryobacteraceae bacterium]